MWAGSSVTATAHWSTTVLRKKTVTCSVPTTWAGSPEHWAEIFRRTIRADSVVAVTTNSSYVIGQTYVGGIVGQNEQNVTLKNCVNNGVAV